MLKPKKRWGQNFLNDPNIAKKIISLLGNISDEKILEIGPGDGALTKLMHADGFSKLSDAIGADHLLQK